MRSRGRDRNAALSCGVWRPTNNGDDYVKHYNHLIGQDQAKINERAVNAFMLMQVSISSHKGFKPLINAVTKIAKATKVADEAKRMTEILAVLGPLQKPIDEVIAAQSLLRTYLYKQTLAFNQSRRGRTASQR
jgi:hypothetical protein